MTYQMSFFTPQPTRPRRRPRQRQGESWFAFCVRAETWCRLARREPSAGEKQRAIDLNSQFRERCLRSSEVFCYRQVERAKAQTLPGAVFFWFGGEVGYPGPQSQYVTQAGLDFLLAQSRARPSRRGKVRVSFGPCLSGR